MFAVVPLGVEGGQVRFPVVGLSILVGCVLVFGLTWLAEPDPLGADPEMTKPVLEYWSRHPYLDIPEVFSRRFLGPSARTAIEGARAKWALGASPPSRSLVEAEQRELDALAEAALMAARDTLFRRLALTPARGWVQPGWLTHLFVHAGWMHLIGNMLFLYAVSLLLEDAWGRWRFLAFYLAGGLLSGAAEFLLNRDSGMVLVGASGAVSACIGAAMVRFAARKMRLGYFIFLGIFFRTGTFAMPVWLWGVLKAGGEVMDLVTGSSPGVAVLAHVVGLSFGAGVALLMRWTGKDKELVATDEASSKLEMSYSFDVEEAHRLANEGDYQRAREHFERARAASATDVDAEWGLFELDVRDGRRAAAVPHLERAVQVLLRQGQAERARDFFVAGWKQLKPADVRPGLALLVAKTLGALLPRNVLIPLWMRAGEDHAPSSVFATLNGVELALEAGDADVARHGLARLETQAPPVSATKERLLAARARLRSLDGDLEPEPLAAPRLVAARQRLEASVVSARSDGLGLVLRSGQPRLVPLSELKAVAAGFVPGAGPHRILVVFLVLDWGVPGRPAVLLKLDSATGGVDRLRPNAPPEEVWLQFLTWLADKSGALALPSRAQLGSGQLPFCGDVGALETALFA